LLSSCMWMALAAGLVEHATGPPSLEKAKDFPKAAAKTPVVGMHTSRVGAKKVAKGGFSGILHLGGLTLTFWGEKMVASRGPAPPDSQRLSARP
jgi:hypothetical protein